MRLPHKPHNGHLHRHTWLLRRVKNFLLSMSNSAFLCIFLHKCGRKLNLTFRKQKILDPTFTGPFYVKV